jgi:predicted phosphodiesterase
MRAAALYDIHGNSFALRAVLAELERERPDLILVGGDIVLGPFPTEALALLAEFPGDVRYIRGNTEREVAQARTSAADPTKPWAARAAWVSDRLSPAQARFLSGLPEQLVLDVDGLGPTLFCHGSPRSDEEIVTYLTGEERLSEILREVQQRTVVLGHTHVQFDRSAVGIRVINAGSVGLPYEDRPGAYWAMLGPEVALRRTEYDVQAAAAAASKCGFPDAEDFVKRFMLEPASRQEASTFFEQMALDRAKSSTS